MAIHQGESMKIQTFLLVGLFASVAFAASTFEESSGELAKDIAPTLNGKTVAVLDFLDQQKNVRELGRVFADQYLRVDLSKLGVKTVTRSALDRALGEIKLSQAGLTDAINGGLGDKFKAADVIVTGSLSQIGDSYTASVEAIDVKTGSSLVSSRSTFPKIASVQTLWDHVLEESSATNPITVSQTNSIDSQSNTLTKGYSTITLSTIKDNEHVIDFIGCIRVDSSSIKCGFWISNTGNNDRGHGFDPALSYAVDPFGRRVSADLVGFVYPGVKLSSNGIIYPNVRVLIEAYFKISEDIKNLALIQIHSPGTILFRFNEILIR